MQIKMERLRQFHHLKGLPYYLSKKDEALQIVIDYCSLNK